MTSQLKERCIYCGADVYYNGSEQLIKCGMCGHTLVVAKFENELAKMNAALEEGEAAKRALEEAEKEKQAAGDRLFAALSSLEGLQDGQNTGLLVLRKIADAQEDAGDRLAVLHDLSERIVNSQDDIFNQLEMQKEIASRLQVMDLKAEESRQLMNDFVRWCQNAGEEDYQYLKKMNASAEALLQGQKEIGERVKRLQQTAGQTQRSVEEFQKQYTEDKLKILRNLWHQAENHQQDHEYDKAETGYRQLLVEGGEDLEVYWRLLLCHYCVSYQQGDRGNMIPIILNPDLTDPGQMSLRREFSQLLKKTDAGQRKIYEEELGKIDRILDKYRQVCHEVDYDVFISVRQKEDRHYTTDSDIASDLYDFLTRKGIKVFNSRRTRIPAGQEFEPYIIASLISAKVMIVVGTSAENMNARWVRNEWSRFQWLMKNEQEKYGKTEKLILCYLAGEMDYSEIPRALNPNRQAIRAGIGADDQLIATLGFLKRNEASDHGHVPVDRAGTKPVDDPSENIGVKEEDTPRQIINQMTAWLYRKQYADVLKKYDELSASGKYLEFARIHLCALCAEMQVEDIEHLVRSNLDLSIHPIFKLAMRLCADSEEQKYLRKLQKENQDHNRPRSNKINMRVAAGIAAALAIIVIAFALSRKNSVPEPTASGTPVIETLAKVAEEASTDEPEMTTEVPETETEILTTESPEEEAVRFLRKAGFEEKAFDLQLVQGSWAGYEGRSHTTSTDTRCCSEGLISLANGASYVVTISDSEWLGKTYEYGYLVFAGDTEGVAMIDRGWEAFTDISLEQIETRLFGTDIQGDWKLAINVRRKDEASFTDEEIEEVEGHLREQLIIWEAAN